MDGGESGKWLEQLVNIVTALITPTVYAFLGRIAYLVHTGTAISLWRFIQELSVIVFMGAVSGGAATALKFDNPAIAGAFIAATSFYGPKIVVIILEYVICKYKFKGKTPCHLDILEFDLDPTVHKSVKNKDKKDD